MNGRGDRGERFRNASGSFLLQFQRFRGIPTLGTEKSITNHPEPTGQIPKSPKYILKEDIPENSFLKLFLPYTSATPGLLLGIRVGILVDSYRDLW